jgi:hypothetical protein
MTEVENMGRPCFGPICGFFSGSVSPVSLPEKTLYACKKLSLVHETTTSESHEKGEEEGFLFCKGRSPPLPVAPFLHARVKGKN